MRLWKFIKSKMELNLLQTVSEYEASLTFEEIIMFAEKFSKNLRGIKCCAIMCQSEMAASMALLSCFAAGVTALPLSPRYGKAHCNKILKAISPDAMITDQDGSFQIFYINDSEYKEPEKHIALIMCTSGTTGTPKGAMLTETNIMTNVSDIALYFNIDSSDTILISRPLYHCAVLTGEFLISLIKGVKIRFYSGEFNPIIVYKMVKDYQSTAFCSTPTVLSLMARCKKHRDKDMLKHICISGECMGAKTGNKIAKAFPNADIYHLYGLTEACPRVSYLPPHLFSKYPDYVGIPLQSVSLKIISHTGKPARTNEVGVLWVKGKNVMEGYYNDSLKTSEVIKDGWLCTGDLALLNEKGLLKIKGRNDDLIIKAGMNIYLKEIENALIADDRVSEVYARGYTDQKYGAQIELNIVGDFLNTDEIKKLCHKNLPSYQIPKKINLLKELPKNGSGKIIRR